MEGEGQGDGHSRWSAFVGAMCIKYLVMHIISKARYLYKRTNHEDDWLLYHDALSLMTAKDCINWMKETSVPGKDQAHHL